MKAKGFKAVFARIVSVFLTVQLFNIGVFAKEDDVTQKPDSANKEEKVVYLTFDDGPIPGITDKILDVLAEHEVKATFFIVGKEVIGRESELRKIYEKGHSIGLHTYSHKFSKIYKNDEAFIEEMDQTGELVEKLLNYKAQAIRFPGGSDKILSYELLDKLHDSGYRIYDWNADLGDGVNGAASVEKLINNAKKIKGDKNNVFLLAHCNSNNKNTLKALPYIIQYYKSAGYTFKPIEKDTKEYYYKIKKRRVD
ncbi:polysaccharide deacetylase family protein [Clostridium thermarum]|uniref:polysaccharide deacetylase family protein n=1 Tax=Clostridium thermarum TaxID=1716543 RepID=UPI001120A981|nr:polysaccharide deacetylase family protein [Clostridium thermarum]